MPAQVADQVTRPAVDGPHAEVMHAGNAGTDDSPRPGTPLHGAIYSDTQTPAVIAAAATKR